MGQKLITDHVPNKGDLVSKTVFFIKRDMGPCPNKGDLVSKAAFIALFFSSRFFLSHMAICIPIKFSIYMGEVGLANLIRDQYLIADQVARMIKN